MNLSLKFVAAAATTEPGLIFVALMGICTVMIGLICLIFLTSLMGWIMQKFTKSEEPAKPTIAQPENSSASSEIPNRSEMIAAVTAVIAEELGTDISALRVHSFRRVDR